MTAVAAASWKASLGLSAGRSERRRRENTEGTHTEDTRRTEGRRGAQQGRKGRRDEKKNSRVIRLLAALVPWRAPLLCRAVVVVLHSSRVPRRDSTTVTGGPRPRRGRPCAARRAGANQSRQTNTLARTQAHAHGINATHTKCETDKRERSRTCARPNGQHSTDAFVSSRRSLAPPSPVVATRHTFPLIPSLCGWQPPV